MFRQEHATGLESLRFFRHTQTILTPTHIIIAYRHGGGQPTWFDAVPFPNQSALGSSKDPILSASHRGPALEWLTNITLLSSTPSRVVIMATILHVNGEVSVLIVNLQFKEDGLLAVMKIRTQSFEDVVFYNVCMSSGKGSEIHSRGVWFMAQGAHTRCHALRVTTDLEAESGVCLEVGKHALAENIEPTSSAFDGCRGRLAYVDEREVVIVDYV